MNECVKTIFYSDLTFVKITFTQLPKARAISWHAPSCERDPSRMSSFPKETKLASKLQENYVYSTRFPFHLAIFEPVLRGNDFDCVPIAKVASRSPP
jgi:hypothetical protein